MQITEVWEMAPKKVGKTVCFVRFVAASAHSPLHTSAFSSQGKGDDAAKPVPLIGRFGTSLKIGIVGPPNVGWVEKLYFCTQHHVPLLCLSKVFVNKSHWLTPHKELFDFWMKFLENVLLYCERLTLSDGSFFISNSRRNIPLSRTWCRLVLMNVSGMMKTAELEHSVIRFKDQTLVEIFGVNRLVREQVQVLNHSTVGSVHWIFLTWSNWVHF